MDIFSTIVGTHFRDSEAKRLVNDDLTIGETAITFEREPDNAYDALAVKVIYQDCHIGYLARGNNAAIAAALDDGKSIAAKVIAFEARKPVVQITW